MRIGSKKYVLFKFVPYEYKAFEKYLEKMALKGWILESMPGSFLKFVKGETKALKYTVDVMDEVSLLEGNDGESVVECREYCESAGWKFICQRDKIQVYCKENGVDNILIHIDEEEKFNSIFKSSLKYCILNIFSVSLLLWSQYMSSFGSAYSTFLADNYIIILLLIFGLWLTQECIQLVDFIIWALKGRRSLKNHEEVSYDCKLIANVRIAFNKIMILLLIAMVISLIASGLMATQAINFILVLSISIAIGILLVIIINKSDWKEQTARVVKILGITIIITIDLIIFSRITITVGVNGIMESNDDSGSYSLTLEDFNDMSKGYDYKYADNKKSVLLSYERYLDEGNEAFISYDLYKSRYKPLINYALDKEIKLLNKYDAKIELLDNNIFNNIKIYQSDNKKRFILASDNMVISIYIDDNKLSQDEILKIIYENVFKSVSLSYAFNFLEKS